MAPAFMGAPANSQSLASAAAARIKHCWPQQRSRPASTSNPKIVMLALATPPHRLASLGCWVGTSTSEAMMYSDGSPAMFFALTAKSSGTSGPTRTAWLAEKNSWDPSMCHRSQPSLAIYATASRRNPLPLHKPSRQAKAMRECARPIATAPPSPTA